MNKEVKASLLKRGIQPLDTVVDFSFHPESPQNVALFPYLQGLQTDLGTSSSPSLERKDSVFDGDWAFFTNIIVMALREDLNSLVRSAKKALVALTLCGSSCWKALWNDWACDEKYQMDKSVNSLTLQRVTSD